MLIARLFWNAYLAYQMIGQSRLPFKPLETIKRFQAWRVRKMVAHAYRTVPYYRETMDRMGLKVGDFQNAGGPGQTPSDRAFPASESPGILHLHRPTDRALPSSLHRRQYGRSTVRLSYPKSHLPKRSSRRTRKVHHYFTNWQTVRLSRNSNRFTQLYSS